MIGLRWGARSKHLIERLVRQRTAMAHQLLACKRPKIAQPGPERVRGWPLNDTQPLSRQAGFSERWRRSRRRVRTARASTDSGGLRSSAIARFCGGSKLLVGDTSHRPHTVCMALSLGRRRVLTRPAGRPNEYMIAHTPKQLHLRPPARPTPTIITCGGWTAPVASAENHAPPPRRMHHGCPGHTYREAPHPPRLTGPASSPSRYSVTRNSLRICHAFP